MCPLMAARSDPQIPLTLGITRTQSRAGIAGSGTSPSLSIERALVATSGRPPAAFTTAKAGMERTYWSASTFLSRPPPSPPPPWGGGVGFSLLHAPPDFGGGGAGHARAAASRDHGPP